MYIHTDVLFAILLVGVFSFFFFSTKRKHVGKMEKERCFMVDIPYSANYLYPYITKADEFSFFSLKWNSL